MHALLCQNLMKWNNGTLNGLASLAITQNSTSHFPPLPSNKESNKQVQHEKASHWECQQSFLLVPISSVHYHPSEWKLACLILGILLFKLESMLVLKSFVCDELSRKCRKMNTVKKGKEIIALVHQLTLIEATLKAFGWNTL